MEKGSTFPSEAALLVRRIYESALVIWEPQLPLKCFHTILWRSRFTSNFVKIVHNTTLITITYHLCKRSRKLWWWDRIYTSVSTIDTKLRIAYFIMLDASWIQSYQLTSPYYFYIIQYIYDIILSHLHKMLLECKSYIRNIDCTFYANSFRFC